MAGRDSNASPAEKRRQLDDLERRRNDFLETVVGHAKQAEEQAQQ